MTRHIQKTLQADEKNRTAERYRNTTPHVHIIALIHGSITVLRRMTALFGGSSKA
jgi:hypothetical protein